MISELLLIQGIVERALIFTMPTISVFLTSRVINFDDLTIEGSFGLGGALMALCMFHNVPLLVSIPVVCIGGALAGTCTAMLNTYLKMNNLISGIVVMTGLFSINLMIAGSNLSVAKRLTVFALPGNFFGNFNQLLVLAILVLLLVYLITRFLETEIGFLFRCMGNNVQFITNLGKNKNVYLIACLALANSITALSGALFVQYTGYFSIWANVGILIIALTSLILSNTLFLSSIIGLIAGSIMYQTILAITFEFNIDQNWNKLITALLIIVLIATKRIQHVNFRKYFCHHTRKTNSR